MNQRKYGRTLSACLAGISNQAVITNVTALLFVPFADLYGFSFLQLGLLTAVNFGAQMLADVLLVLLIDRFSRKKLALAAAAASAAGLAFYGCVPLLFTGGALYGGIAAATAVFAFSGGMLEVVLSDVADSLPRGAPVSICLLHTAYAWAQAVLAILLYGYMTVCGGRWNFAMFFFALVPAAAFFLILRADLDSAGAHAEEKTSPSRAFLEENVSSVQKNFGIFCSLALAAIFFGHGAEVAMNQWASALFYETVHIAECGEFFGTAAFAALLGTGGIFYIRLAGKKAAFPFSVLLFSGAATFVCYLCAALCTGAFSFAGAAACGLFVGILSPGTMTAASENLPRAGGRLIASLAVASDLGAAVLPAAAGALSQSFGLNASFLILSAAPFACMLAVAAMRRIKNGNVIPLKRNKLLKFR